MNDSQALEAEWVFLKAIYVFFKIIVEYHNWYIHVHMNTHIT
jgi:hypothetical protein